MLETEAEIKISIECDICGKEYIMETSYSSRDTDLISLHNLEDIWMEDQGYIMANNMCYCKDCKENIK